MKRKNKPLEYVTVNIEHDESAPNPYEDFDMLGNANAYNCHLIRPDNGNLAREIYKTWGYRSAMLDELKAYLKNVCNAVIMVDFMGDGYAWMTKTEIIKEYGKYTPATSRRARRALEAEVKTFEQWAYGEVYGYIITDNETGETLDSCWGYYGEEYAREEAESIARSYDDEIKADKKHLARRIDAACRIPA